MKYKNGREICVPGVYRHFKHTDKGEWNNYIYVTLADTKLITDKQIMNFIYFNHYKYDVLYKVIETETKNELALIQINNRVYLIDCENKVNKTVDYIVYRSLYDNNIYARPKDMFLSPLPEGRYSECNEKYRFELMMNNLKHCTGSRNSVDGKIVIRER